MISKGAVFDVAIVVWEQSDLIVLRSLFSSPRRPAMLGQMCNVICCTGSNSINSGILIMLSESLHLENSQSKLLSDAMVDVSLSMAQQRVGQY